MFVFSFPNFFVSVLCARLSWPSRQHLSACKYTFVCFSFSVLSQEIDWEERFRNDVFCVGCDVKPQLNQSILPIFFLHFTAVLR